MLERVLEMFAQGWVVELGSYYGAEVAEDAEAIRECFEEVEEDEAGWLYVDVKFFEEEQRVEVFVGSDE